MHKRKLSLLLAGLMSISMLSGCSGGVETKNAKDSDFNTNVNAADVAAYKALSFEELATRTTTEDTEALVYKYVSDQVTVDMSELLEVDTSENSAEKKAIDKVINEINEALRTGESIMDVDDGVLNYMLLKFANTPYTWKHTETDIRGMDSQTRMYFVDVTYETNDGNNPHYKTLLPDSVIVRGSDTEESWKQKRYSDLCLWYESILRAPEIETMQAGMPPSGAEAEVSLYKSNWGKMILKEWEKADATNTLLYGDAIKSEEVVMDGYTDDQKSESTETSKSVNHREYLYETEDGVGLLTYTFEDRWGSIEELRRMQEGSTLMERVREVVREGVEPEIGIVTYSGLTEVAASHGAKMTFRFLLKPVYTLGLEENLAVQSMYLNSYELKDQDRLLSKYQTETITNGEVFMPYIEVLYKSYSKAVEETNHIGLFKLIQSYQKYDSYMAQVQDATYLKHGGFSVEAIGRKGNELACVVTQELNERAKGTYMTMPTYLMKYLIKVKLCEDNEFRLVSITTLDANLVGEPLSMIREVSGVSDKISYNEGNFTTANQTAIEKVIQKFELALLESDGTVSSDLYADLIDIGISKSTKQTIAKYFEAVHNLGSNQSIVWLTGYETKTNIYVKAKLREYFHADKAYTTEATISLAYRNNAWRVVGYERTLSVMTEKVPSTDGCLLLNDLNETGDKRSQLFTQVKEVSGVVGGMEEEPAVTSNEGESTITTVDWGEEAYTGTTVATDSEGNPITEETTTTQVPDNEGGETEAPNDILEGFDEEETTVDPLAELFGDE